MVLYGSMLSFARRSQVVFRAEKDPMVKLPFEKPSAARPIGAMSLRSREPSPLARPFTAHLLGLSIGPEMSGHASLPRQR